MSFYRDRKKKKKKKHRCAWSIMSTGGWVSSGLGILSEVCVGSRYEIGLDFVAKARNLDVVLHVIRSKGF